MGSICILVDCKVCSSEVQSFFFLSLMTVFEPYKDSKVDLLGPKLLFIALNLGGLALGIWKVRCIFLIFLERKNEKEK